MMAEILSIVRLDCDMLAAFVVVMAAKSLLNSAVRHEPYVSLHIRGQEDQACPS